jgi:hypothetical protein
VVAYALSSPPRDLVEQWMNSWNENEKEKYTAKSDKFREHAWKPIKELGLWKYLTPTERSFTQTTSLTMTHEQQGRASWRIESVQVLMWALSLLDALPSLDIPANHGLLKQIPLQKSYVRSAKLRPRDEITQARDEIELWHWRSRTRQLTEEGDAFGLKPPENEAKKLDGIVRATTGFALEDGSLTEAINEDFAINGKSYRDLTEQEWQRVRSTTYERHFALNWLCGYAPRNRWDQTPTDT